MEIKFKDRTQAGRLLAIQLMAHANDPEVLVVALSRGGIPVAFEVAMALNAPLDIYRDSCLLPNLKGRIVILIDDGIATGSTMSAAVAALRQLKPLQIIIAAPITSPFAYEILNKEVDEFVCVTMPERFEAIDLWYHNFKEITDQEVRELLSLAAKRYSTSSSLGKNDKENLWREQARKAALYYF
jgi:predicted phosphoribosyltransferase